MWFRVGLLFDPSTPRTTKKLGFLGHFWDFQKKSVFRKFLSFLSFLSFCHPEWTWFLNLFLCVIFGVIQGRPTFRPKYTSHHEKIGFFWPFLGFWKILKIRKFLSFLSPDPKIFLVKMQKMISNIEYSYIFWTFGHFAAYAKMQISELKKRGLSLKLCWWQKFSEKTRFYVDKMIGWQNGWQKWKIFVICGPFFSFSFFLIFLSIKLKKKNKKKTGWQNDRNFDQKVSMKNFPILAIFPINDLILKHFIKPPFFCHFCHQHFFRIQFIVDNFLTQKLACRWQN